ncbi:MAG TPA: rhodanese-like domain-containing protein, partial [Chloroflexia bacterium]|nr:rhodanese-like domain-containing protein [Chloroflexia bacterium]
DRVPSHKPVAVVCGGGTRSSIAASLLQGEGFDPMHVSGGMDAWNSSGYPLANESVSAGADAAR